MVRREGVHPDFAVARLFRRWRRLGRPCKGSTHRSSCSLRLSYAKLLQFIAPRLVATGLIEEAELIGGELSAARLDQEASHGAPCGDIAVSVWACV